MSTAPLYNGQGTKVGDVELNPRLFDVPMKQALVHEAVLVQQANARQVLAHTKDRSEVRGGGKKPWRQKGTGRARHGSSRSPIWIGGGVTFGPRKDRNFTLRINRKARQKAIRMILSDKARDGVVVVVDQLAPSTFKTKPIVDLVAKLPVKRHVLLIIPAANPKVTKSVANAPMLDAIRADSLNVLDLLWANALVIVQDSLATMASTFAKE